MDSFILQLWGRVLRALRYVSPLELIWRLFPRTQSHGWVDVWVLVNSGAAVVALALAARARTKLTWVLLLYGGVRVIEIIVYQAKVVLFDGSGQVGSKQGYAVRSYRRIVVLALHNYVEVVCWFAASYAAMNTLFGENAQIISTVTGALYFSVVTMATVGYGDITPCSNQGRLLVTTQIAIGLFMTLVILARMVSFLPTPRTLDHGEKARWSGSAKGRVIRGIC